MSLVAQRFDRIEPRGTPGRIDRRQNRKDERHADDGCDILCIDDRRKPRQEIKLGRKEIGVQQPVQDLPDRLDIVGDDKPEQEAGKCARRCRSRRR